MIARKSRKDGETLSQGQVQGPCPWLRVSPSFRLLRAITKSCVSIYTFRGVYANVRPRLCRRNLTSVTCQDVPGPLLSFGRWGLGTRLIFFAVDFLSVASFHHEFDEGKEPRRRRERSRERHAAESSEQREARLTRLRERRAAESSE